MMKVGLVCKRTGKWVVDVVADLPGQFKFCTSETPETVASFDSINEALAFMERMGVSALFEPREIRAH